MTIATAWSLLRERWELAVVVFLAFLLAAGGVALTRPPQYSSSGDVYLTIDSRVTNGSPAKDAEYLNARIAGFAALAQSDLVLNEVSDGVGVSTAELRRSVDAARVEGTSIVAVTATSGDPERAETIARSLIGIYREALLEVEVKGEVSTLDVRITTQPGDAVVTSQPALAYLALGGLAGLLVGAGLAIFTARLDRRVRCAEDVAEATGAPVIAEIRHGQGPLDPGAAGGTADDYRLLRDRLMLLSEESPLRTIVVASATRGVESRDVAVGLATVISRGGSMVCLVDADLSRRERDAKPGLTELLRGASDVDGLVSLTDISPFATLSAGSGAVDPGELLLTDRLPEVLEELAARFEFVILHAPPLADRADAAVLAIRTDGMVLAAAQGRETTTALRDAAAQLSLAPVRVLGAVLVRGGGREGDLSSRRAVTPVPAALPVEA